MDKARKFPSGVHRSLKLGLWTLGALLLCLTFFAGWLAWRSHMPTTDVYLGNMHVRAKVAHAPEHRTRGLSGSPSLAPNEGMLFVFDAPAAQPMWMKDMNYSLDIVWLDDQKKVVHIEEYVTPESYPRTYRSPVAALYVLELPAGSVDRHNIDKGAIARFSL